MRLTGFLLFSACMLAAQEASKAPAPQTASQPVIRTGAQEVLLDLIVRDKKGKAVRDLNPNELEVYDEGTLQKVTSFRLVTANDEVGLGSGAERKQYDPMRQLRLVSVVFEGLDNESRRMTRQAALEFLKNPLEQNVYMAVFIIDQRLYVLQQFTNDRELLRRAIDTATTRQYTEFANQSAAIRKQLEQVEQNLNIAGTGSQPGRGNPGGGGFGSGMASARMAQMTLNILRYEETLTSDQQSRSSIYSLMAIIREQAGLPGRKTLVYFSGGLTVSEALIQQFRSIIGAANRANVSVYGVDARGLNSDALNTTGTSLLTSAADSSRTQQLSDASINPDQVKEFDTLRDSIHSNPQQKLDELSTSTGGFMIANTNDFRPLLRRMSEDIETYYELAYAPQITTYDGRFRRISLKVGRPNVKVQTRSGYFALPPNESSVMAYEMPLLNALNAATLPRSFQYHAAALHFGRQNDKLEYGLVVEVPMRDMTFTEDKEHNQYKAHIGMLALIKNSKGEVVRRFSRDVPVTAPADKVEAFRRGNFTQTYHLALAPGRYTLESAIMDQEGMKGSAKRVSVVVPVEPASAVSLSSLALIRRIEAQSSGAQVDSEDPFHFQGGRVVPTLDGTIAVAGGRELSYYFVVYPMPSSAEKPQLTMVFLHDGKVVAKATPELPAADAKGIIRYVASLPLTSFAPGDYEVRTIVKQGATAAEEHAVFTINP